MLGGSPPRPRVVLHHYATGVASANELLSPASQELGFFSRKLIAQRGQSRTTRLACATVAGRGDPSTMGTLPHSSKTMPTQAGARRRNRPRTATGWMVMRTVVISE